MDGLSECGGRLSRRCSPDTPSHGRGDRPGANGVYPCGADAQKQRLPGLRQRWQYEVAAHGNTGAPFTATLGARDIPRVQSWVPLPIWLSFRTCSRQITVRSIEAALVTIVPFVLSFILWSMFDKFCGKLRENLTSKMQKLCHKFWS